MRILDNEKSLVRGKPNRNAVKTRAIIVEGSKLYIQYESEPGSKAVNLSNMLQRNRAAKLNRIRSTAFREDNVFRFMKKGIGSIPIPIAIAYRVRLDVRRERKDWTLTFGIMNMLSASKKRVQTSASIEMTPSE